MRICINGKYFHLSTEIFKLSVYVGAVRVRNKNWKKNRAKNIILLSSMGFRWRGRILKMYNSRLFKNAWMKMYNILQRYSLINLFHSIWSVCRYIFSRKKSKNDLECIQLKPWLHKMGFFSDFADSNIFSVLVIIWSKICFTVSITYRMKLQEESYKGHLPLNNQ